MVGQKLAGIDMGYAEDYDKRNQVNKWFLPQQEDAMNGFVMPDTGSSYIADVKQQQTAPVYKLGVETDLTKKEVPVEEKSKWMNPAMLGAAISGLGNYATRKGQADAQGAINMARAKWMGFGDPLKGLEGVEQPSLYKSVIDSLDDNARTADELELLLDPVKREKRRQEAQMLEFISKGGGPALYANNGSFQGAPPVISQQAQAVEAQKAAEIEAAKEIVKPVENKKLTERPKQGAKKKTSSASKNKWLQFDFNKGIVEKEIPKADPMMYLRR